MQGWVLQPIHHGTTPATRVMYVVQENMKGWVPGFAKKSLARRPLAIALVNEYLQKKAERMRVQRMRSNAVAASAHAASGAGAAAAVNSCSSVSSTPFASMSNASATTVRFQSTRRPSLLANNNSTVSARSNK